MSNYKKKFVVNYPRENEREYQDVKQYFLKFEESQNFFEIDETLSNEAKACIRASSLDDIGDLSLKLNKTERVIRDYLLRYTPDRELMFDCALKQLSSNSKYKKIIWNGNTNITYHIQNDYFRLFQQL